MRAPGGTRFRLYPQSPAIFDAPETIWVSPPPGSIGPGPSDAQLQTVLPAGSKPPYDPPFSLPPFDGARLPGAQPDDDGHFDHIDPSSPQFFAAHLYGSARFALDVWERHLDRPMRWWHEGFLPSLELIPVVDWNNAHSGFGFLETGARANRAGVVNPFCLDFDVVAHEIGHQLVFGELGFPALGRLTPQYLAFHETMADLAAMLAAMEFGSVVERFLDQTEGNLYALGVLGRLAEMAQNEQLRLVDFDTRVGDFDRFAPGADGALYDPSGERRTVHQLSQPLTAAFFAILIELYQDELVQLGVIPPDDDARGWTRVEVADDFARLQSRFGRLYGRRRAAFREALARARDWIGRSLALTLERLSADDLTFAAIAATFLGIARRRGMAANDPAFRQHFLDRDIDPDAVPMAATVAIGAGAVWRAGAAADPASPPMNPWTAIQRLASVQRLFEHEFRAAPQW